MSDHKYIITSNGELYHYGVLGMKWGVHRAKRNIKKGNSYRGKAYGTGSMADGTYKPPKDASESAFTKNMNKSESSYRKADAGMRKTYERASKKLAKLDKKADKAVEKAYEARYKADKKAGSFLASEKKINKAKLKADKAMGKAVVKANKARKWLNSMDKTFSTTTQSLSSEQIALGQKYVDIMNSRVFS